MHIAILVSHPIQYYVPLYREIAKRNDLELTVIYVCRAGVDVFYDQGFGQQISWDIPLLDGYRHSFISSGSDSDKLNMAVVRALRRIKPDVLLAHGYDKPTNILAILAAKLFGISVLIRSDTRLTPQNRNTKTLKNRVKRAIFGLVDGFVAIGSLNRDFYLANKVPSHKLLFAPFSVNNQFFEVLPDRHLSLRNATRGSLGIPLGATVLVSASKLIAIKRVDDIIRAFAIVAREVEDLTLLIVGSGEGEANLRALVQSLKLDRVVFAGFKNQSELPAIFAASDIFALASEVEPWGLAVNEAMASGLPCVVSDQVGCAIDLVEKKKTGRVFPCGDIDQFATSIFELATDVPKRKEIGGNAKSLISEWDNVVCATKLVDACFSVATRRS